MNAPAPVPAGAAIPWYRSTVVIAQVSSAITGLVALAPKSHLVAALGLANPDVVSDYVTGAFGVAAAIAQFVAFMARVRSSVQPVTLTQTGADLHPNTLAAQAPAVNATGFVPQTKDGSKSG